MSDDHVQIYGFGGLIGMMVCGWISMIVCGVYDPRLEIIGTFVGCVVGVLFGSIIEKRYNR